MRKIDDTNKFQQHATFYPDAMITFGDNWQVFFSFLHPMTLNQGQGHTDKFQNVEFKVSLHEV